MADVNEPKKETVRITLPPREGETASSDIVRLPGAPDRPVPVTPEAGGTSQSSSSPAPPASSRSAADPPMARSPNSSAAPPTPSTPPSPFRPPAVPPPSAPRATSTVAENAETPAVAMPPRPRVLPPAPRVVNPAAPSSGASAAFKDFPGSGSQTRPKQETARINTSPKSSARSRAGVAMGKTQPLLTVPQPNRDPAVISHRVPAPAVVTPGATPSGVDAIPMPLLWLAFGISAITLIIQIWNYFGS